MVSRLNIFLGKQYITRNYSSVLYITGDKANKTYAVLTPIIDFEQQLENKDSLIRNLVARKLPIDLDRLEKRWRFFQSVEDRKKVLELTRTEIGKLISELMNDEERNKNEIETLKLHSKMVKDDLKNVKDYGYGLAEDTMLQILDLPNLLHEKTPLEPITSYKYIERVEEKSKCHMDIGEKHGYLEYVDQFTCYLKSDAALFEMGILNYGRHQLLESGFTMFSNSNFCRSVVAEGCGDKYANFSKVLTIEEEESIGGLNRLHLCGSASLYPFMAYFTKHLIPPSCLPLKLFSLGKRYHPVAEAAPQNLFNLSQESNVSIFVASLEENDLLDELQNLVIALYQPLGYHFKMVLLPACELEKSECLRLSIQMYSNFLEVYVEVGNVSLYDNYLSKRLLFTYNVDKQPKYPKVIAGTLLNVPRLLGCILENNSLIQKELLTSLVKKHLFC